MILHSRVRRSPQYLANRERRDNLDNSTLHFLTTGLPPFVHTNTVCSYRVCRSLVACLFSEALLHERAERDGPGWVAASQESWAPKVVRR